MTNHQALFEARLTIDGGTPLRPTLSKMAAEAWRLGYEAALLNTTNARHETLLITNPFDNEALPVTD